MSVQRIYKPFMLFNLRIVNMQHLWVPSTEYKGQQTQKPNYFATCVVDKTRQGWWEEPMLAPAWAAYSELLAAYSMQPNMITEWPVKDGDMPAEPGKPPADWAKGRWIIGGSSSNAIKVEQAQTNGSVTLLGQRVGVKPGDYVALGLSAAIKQNNARGIKNYCNTVLFMGAGEEIAVGQSVTGAELAEAARKQGLQVQGFQPSGGYGAQPGPGMMPGGPQPGFQPPGGAHGPGPGFSPGSGGYAPMTAGPAPTQYASPPNGGAAPGSAYPSSPQPGTPPAAPFQPQGAPGFNPGSAGPNPAPGYAPTTGGPAYAGPAPGQMQTGPVAYPSSPQPGPGQQQQWAPPPNFAPGGH